jgi:CubicO group peptidase (beta-lactamase class C family)
MPLAKPRLLFALLFLFTTASPALAEPPAGFDERVREVMAEHGVPGMAVAIVEDGRVVHAKGYGVRRLGSPEPVGPDTIFPTGSTGKAVTATALAILVDEGRIGWDDRVIDHMPDFRMYDPWVTREMTIRDLLVHRSGLGLGAGDLLFVPRTSRSRMDIVRALRHIRPATSFRSGYAYDNVLYVVAGQLIEEVTGDSWEVFVRERVLEPAGMLRSTTEESARFSTEDRAQPHARVDGAFRGLGPLSVLDERKGLGEVAAPAGGVSSSANDFARWLQIQLGRGALPGGDGRLYSEAVAREMFTPQQLIPIRGLPGELAAATPQFSAYALGWQVQDYRGMQTIQHGGAVFGVQTMVVLVPERNIGFSLQINSEDGLVLRGLMLELLDHYLEVPEPKDWVAAFAEFVRKRGEAATAALASDDGRPRAVGRPSLPLASYAGDFADPWYGPITVRLEGRRLRMDFSQTPDMTGTMTHWRHDTFRVDWDDATLEPAFATFALDADGKVARITMKPVSPLADFSYNFADLDFRPAPKKE